MDDRENLREAIRLADRVSWPELEAERATCLLVIVLCKQGRYAAARDEERKLKYRENEKSLVGIDNAEWDLAMEKYDFEVSIWHGRSQGRCKPRLDEGARIF
jgi:hypothetical protein